MQDNPELQHESRSNEKMDSTISSQVHLNALESLGLSQYESKCFLAALQSGPATINQIGIVAGVPRTKVYGAMRKLVERGLLEQSDEDSKIFVASSPKDVLIPLLEKEERRIKRGLEALMELEVIHQSMKYVKKAESHKTKVLRYFPRAGVTRKLKDLFQNARATVLILSTASGTIRLAKMADILFERSRLGLRLELFTSERDEPVFSTAVQSFKEIENSSVNLIPSVPPLTIVVIDGQYLMVTELKPDDIRDEGMDVGFFVQSTEMAEMMEGLIRALGAAKIEPTAQKKSA